MATRSSDAIDARAIRVGGAPPGHDAAVLLDLVRRARGPVLFVARHDRRLAEMADALAFRAPELPVLEFPAWDCQPYDRISPHPEISARRSAVLTKLAEPGCGPSAILTSVNALIQRVPEPKRMAGSRWHARVGDPLELPAVSELLQSKGYLRVPLVEGPGEYALRGGILDVYGAGMDAPLRLEVAFDTLESIRRFEPAGQRSCAKAEEAEIVFAGEAVLDKAAVARFRRRYLEAFGVPGPRDPVFANLAEGRRHPGFEHWLPFLHERLATLLDYLPGAPVLFDEMAEEAFGERQGLIADLFRARLEFQTEAERRLLPIYRAVAPEALYLGREELSGHLADRPVRNLVAGRIPVGANAVDAGGRSGRSFAPERIDSGADVFLAVGQHIEALRHGGRGVLLAVFSEGSLERTALSLADSAGIEARRVDGWREFEGRNDVGTPPVAIAVWRLSAGYTTDSVAVIAEEDIFGDRFVARGTHRRRLRAAGERIRELEELEPGDLVVHAEFGLGRFKRLETVEAGGIAHDCVTLEYARGDLLRVPVENLDLLYRYGESEGAQLDRLGGGSWQARKSAASEDILRLAEELIGTAAERAVRTASRVEPGAGGYEAFCARFPYLETDDQLAAVEETIADLRSGHPMDRLICGDVGFGKTEVALRAAHAVAFAGGQVAVIAPTTLLARQHYHTFCERFAGFPVEVAMLSRFVSLREAARVREGIANGEVSIVIGTHALLSESVRFADLCLAIVDEEQQFGVRQKERLKALRKDVHVLTLTATPIPRTLQLAMSGIRPMSLIQTPPVDRLAVRTYVLPFDPLAVREALLREQYRNGQTFMVAPRISDLDPLADFVDEMIPEARFAVAHGQMPSEMLEQRMNDFYDGAYDVLISTAIVGFGLDIPRANTLVVAHSERFGLAQLYQLRGRVGRSKVRAYAYFTLDSKVELTDSARRRIEALRSAEELGGGFSLASQDLDIRGAGNLLGARQAGQIRQVGVGLYQAMLTDAVRRLRTGKSAAIEEDWSPRIELGIPVAIPETYVPDLSTRMALYRRLANVRDLDAITSISSEIRDRFGTAPQEVETLYKVLAIKAVCRGAGIRSVEAGSRGLRLRLHETAIAHPERLVAFVSAKRGAVGLRKNGSLVLDRSLASADERIRCAASFCREVAAALKPRARMAADAVASENR